MRPIPFDPVSRACPPSATELNRLAEAVERAGSFGGPGVATLGSELAAVPPERFGLVLGKIKSRSANPPYQYEWILLDVLRNRETQEHEANKYSGFKDELGDYHTPAIDPADPGGETPRGEGDLVYLQWDETSRYWLIINPGPPGTGVILKITRSEPASAPGGTFKVWGAVKNPGTTNGYVTYGPAEVRVGSNAPGSFGENFPYESLPVGMIVEGTFWGKVQEPDPLPEDPSHTRDVDYYLVNGIYQGAGRFRTGISPYEQITYGFVTGGDQHLGWGTKHVGSLDLTTLYPGPYYLPHWFNSGFAQASAPVVPEPTYGLGLQPAFATGAAIAAIGGFPTHELGSLSVPTARVYVNSIGFAPRVGLSSQSGFNGAWVWGMAGTGPGPVDALTLGGGEGPWPLVTMGPSAEVGTSVSSYIGDGTYLYGSVGLPLPGDEFLGVINPAYSFGHTMGVQGYNISGVLCVTGGIRVPSDGFIIPSGVPVTPGGRLNRFAEGASAYVPTHPMNQGTPLLPAYQERWGIPPDPRGPALFVHGLYIGGGGNIATQKFVRDAIAATSSLNSVTGGQAHLHNNGNLEFKLAPDRWASMTLTLI